MFKHMAAYLMGSIAIFDYDSRGRQMIPGRRSVPKVTTANGAGTRRAKKRIERERRINEKPRIASLMAREALPYSEPGACKPHRRIERGDLEPHTLVRGTRLYREMQR